MRDHDLRILMKEIRIHGRGGQGSVTAAELLAIAAFEDGLYSQAFPAFGVERRGAPVMAFVRDGFCTFIRSYNQTAQPGIRSRLCDRAGCNTDRNSRCCQRTEGRWHNHHQYRAQARGSSPQDKRIALDIIGKPIMNTVMLGAFAGASGEVTADSIKHAVQDRFPGKVGEKNAEAVQSAYDLVVGA